MSSFNMTSFGHTDTRAAFSACSSCRAKNAVMNGEFGLACNADAFISASAFLLIISIIGCGTIGRINIFIIISIIITIIKMLGKSKPDLFAHR